MWHKASLVPPYNENYIPKQIEALPAPLTQLFNADNLEPNFQNLQEKCNEALNELKISCDEAATIEPSTIKQSSSKEWFAQRAVRVTASKFEDVCSTSPDNPSTRGSHVF